MKGGKSRSLYLLGVSLFWGGLKRPCLALLALLQCTDLTLYLASCFLLRHLLFQSVERPQGQPDFFLIWEIVKHLTVLLCLDRE